MSKSSGYRAARQWERDHDVSKLFLTVSVSQKLGTIGALRIIHHAGLPDVENLTLAQYSSDDLDGSQEALLEVIGRLLTAYANRVARAAELGTQAF